MRSSRLSRVRPERSSNGHRPVLPSCTKGLRCVRKMRRFPARSGSARTSLALERLEPCEGKLSRTVLRGGVSGQPLSPTRFVRQTMKTCQIEDGTWTRRVVTHKNGVWRTVIFEPWVTESSFRRARFVLVGGPTILVPAQDLRRVVAQTEVRGRLA